jgi:hypothetical protein
MTLSRRSLMKGGVAVAVALPSARALARVTPSLVIYDSRLSASRSFARRFAAPAIDVAKEDAHFWRTLRTQTPSGRIVGLTRWNDLVLARGYLEEQGKRLHSEVAEGPLFRWDMS